MSKHLCPATGRRVERRARGASPKPGLPVMAAALLLMLSTACDSGPFFSSLPPTASPPPSGVDEPPPAGSDEPPPGIQEPTADTVVFVDIDAEFDQLELDLADPDFPLSPASDLAGLLSNPDDAELLMDEARAQRIAEVHALVAAAEDPDPDWLLTEVRVARISAGPGAIGAAADSDMDVDIDIATEASPGIVVATPGARFVLDYARIDDEGETAGSLTLDDRSRLRFEVRVQRGDDLIETPEGDARAAIVDWHPTIPQRVVLNVPEDLEFGRVAFALRPNLPDAGQQATAERWSSVFTAEVWNLAPATRQVEPTEVLLPLDASFARAENIAFDDDFIGDRVQHWLEEEETPVFVLILEGGDFAVGDLLAHTLPNGLPYGGRVVEVHVDADSSQRLLLLEPDLVEVWQMAESGPDYFVEQGLMPETVAFRIGPALQAEQAAAASGTGRPRLGQAIDAQQEPTPLKFGNIFSVVCDRGETTLTFSPEINLVELEFAFRFQAVAFGTSAFCKIEAKPDVGSKLGKVFAAAGGPATLLFKALFGGGIEAGPFGEVKLSFDSPSFSRFGVEAGYSSAKGVNKKLILPTALSGLLEGGEGLLGIPLLVDGKLSGELGVKAKASLLNPDAGLIGFIVGLFAKDRNALPEVSVSVKGGPAASLGLDAVNAAAVHQLKKNTTAKLKLGLSFAIEPSEVFTKVARWLGARRDFKFNPPLLTLVDAKSELNFEAQAVDDDGAGHASFPVIRDNAFLSRFLPGGSTGRLALEGSSVFNDFNSDVSYDVAECPTRPNSQIESPFVGCVGSFFCSLAVNPVLVCLPPPLQDPDDEPPLEDPPPPEPTLPPPVALNDEYTARKNEDLIVGFGTGLLANDTFIPSDNAVLLEPPDVGSLLAFDPVGSFSYRPPAGFTGVVEFLYRIEGVEPDTGAARASNIAFVTISVVNDAPVAVDDFFELPAGTNILVVPVPGVLANDTDLNNDLLSAVLESGPDVGELSLDPLGGFTYVAPDGFSGSVTFTYRADDGDLIDNLSEPATVTISRAAPPPGCSDPDVNCPFDDISVFELAPCPGHFGGGNLICEQPTTAVTFGSLPPEHRASVVRVTLPDDVGSTQVFEFNLPLPLPIGDDRAVVLPSRESFPVIITLPNGSFEVTQPGNALPVITDVSGEPRLEDGSSVQFGVAGQTAASLTVPSVATVSGPPDGQTLIREVKGLDSVVFIPEGFDRSTVIVYLNEDGETTTAGDPQARGFAIVNTGPTGTPVAGGFEVPLVPPVLIPVIEQAGGINPLQPIVITQTVSNFPVTGFFPPDPIGPSLAPAEADGPPVAAAAGTAMQVPLAGLTPLPAVCPARPTGVRCNAGANEHLLSTNQNGTIRRFSALDGQAAGTFAEFPGFVANNAWKAMQAPDNCIVVSSQTTGLFMYNTTGSRIATDGAGDAVNPGSVQPLIATTDTGVRGFTFHSPSSDVHHLYVGLPTQIVRYDYSVSGTTVLSNRTVVVDEPAARFNDLAIIDGLIHASDEAPDNSAGATDLLRVYSLEGHDLGVLLDDLVTPYQVVELFDGGIGVVSFGTGEIRITDPAGNDRRRYLPDDGNAATSEAPRGLWPQRNGSYLIGGRDGIGVSSLNRHDGSLTKHALANTERFMGGPACLP